MSITEGIQNLFIDLPFDLDLFNFYSLLYVFLLGFSSFLGGGGSHTAVLRPYFWLCGRSSVLVVLRESYAVLKMELGLDMCNTNSLPVVLSCWFLIISLTSFKYNMHNQKFKNCTCAVRWDWHRCSPVTTTMMLSISTSIGTSVVLFWVIMHLQYLPIHSSYNLPSCYLCSIYSICSLLLFSSPPAFY